MSDVATVPLWERMPKEPSRAHEAFRTFRDLGPGVRSMAALAKAAKVSEVHARRWATAWNWWERAIAWDDECRRTEDSSRLASIAEMAETFRKAGEKALNIAIDALDKMDPAEIPPAAAVRLLEFGVKMQRSSAADAEAESTEDPWEQIARALDPKNVT